jgi:flagellar hook-associated protein 3 FlgL
MRITSFMMFNQFISSMQGTQEEFAKLNEQLGSGKKINKPSDDIVGATRAMDYKVSINAIEQYNRNIDGANIQLGYADTVIGSLNDSLVSLHELTAMGSNVQSLDNRQLYSEQAAQYRDYLLSLSNTQLGNKYIFSGYQTNQKAFVYNSATGQYDYQGDNGEIKALIDNGAQTTINIQGSKAFSVSLSEPLPTKLSDGTPVSYVQSTNPATGINTVTVEIGNAGDPNHDTFTFSNVMDMANIVSYAWQYKNTDGSDLSPDAAVSAEMAMHRIAALVKPLDDARVQSLSVQSEIGIRQVLLNDQATRLSGSKVDLQNALSTTEDADMNQTATEIIKTQTALQALMASASKIMSQSLLDFLK